VARGAEIDKNQRARRAGYRNSTREAVSLATTTAGRRARRVSRVCKAP
jgi:hypothetical protein